MTTAHLVLRRTPFLPAKSATPTGLCFAIFMFDFARTGVVANAVRLANALAGEGHETYLLVCDGGGRASHEIDPRVTIVVERPPRFRRSRGLALAAAIPGIRRQLLLIRPDVLLSAGNHGHLATLAASWGLPAMQRVVRISNEPDHPGDPSLLRLLRRALLSVVARLADRLMLVSPRLARHPSLAAASREGRTAVVANGVAVDRVRRMAAEPCDHRWAGQADPLVVTVGRLARQKNLPTLLRAVALANTRRPLNLLVIGSGSEAKRAELLALANSLGIADRVDFAGERANPYPYIRAASAFVLPSLWEGRSNVLLEAMACEVPIVASNTAGDAAELLDYGRFGVLVGPGDPAAMAQAILRQVGPHPVRPGDSSSRYDQAKAIAEACAVLVDGAVAARQQRTDGRRDAAVKAPA
jgi:glycosyltransferase involved in cell wall biosynthesis